MKEVPSTARVFPASHLTIQTKQTPQLHSPNTTAAGMLRGASHQNWRLAAWQLAGWRHDLFERLRAVCQAISFARFTEKLHACQSLS